ncbi:hypothetical protein D3C76_1389050 [compost metagenome]
MCEQPLLNFARDRQTTQPGKDFDAVSRQLAARCQHLIGENKSAVVGQHQLSATLTLN